MGQTDRVHPGWNWLCCGSGKYLEVSLSLLQERRRWEAKLASSSHNYANEDLISSSCVRCTNQERLYSQNICKRLIINCCAIVKQRKLVMQSPIIPHIHFGLIPNIVLEISIKCKLPLLLFLPGAFLVPYLIMLVFLGMPLLYMELTLGQYLRKGPVQAMATVCPLFKGTACSSNIVSKFLSLSLCGKWSHVHTNIVFSLPFRCRRCISGCVVHRVYLLQPYHHLVPVLLLQLLPESTALGWMQQNMEHTKLFKLCNQQKWHHNSQPGVLQVQFIAPEKSGEKHEKNSWTNWQMDEQFEPTTIVSQVYSNTWRNWAIHLCFSSELIKVLDGWISF